MQRGVCCGIRLRVSEPPCKRTAMGSPRTVSQALRAKTDHGDLSVRYAARPSLWAGVPLQPVLKRHRPYCKRLFRSRAVFPVPLLAPVGELMAVSPMQRLERAQPSVGATHSVAAKRACAADIDVAHPRRVVGEQVLLSGCAGATSHGLSGVIHW